MLTFDPYGEAETRDPYPLYTRLRNEAPVCHSADLNAWFLFRYADIAAAALDTERFSSTQGVAIARNSEEQQVSGGRTIISMDPPEHTLYRQAASRHFTPRRIADLRPRVEDIVTSLVDGLEGAGPVDLMAELAIPVPFLVMGELLGVRRQDRPQFRLWAEDVVRMNPTRPDSLARAHEATGSISAYFTEIIEERRADPRDDLISTLTQASIDGRPLSTREVVGYCWLFTVAGTETTTGLIGNGILALAEHPDQLRLLRQNGELLPRAVEEMLRYDAPVQGLARVTTCDVTLHGVTVPEGSKIQLRYGSANRDERMFDEPDRFDITRDAQKHLAFGLGPHFCMGASLARLEASLTFEALLSRFDAWDLREVERDAAGAIRAPSVLRMRL